VVAGWRLLESACFEYSQSVPYAPLSELLRLSAPPDERSQTVLALLPELAGMKGRATDIAFEAGSSAQDQHQLFAALADWFAALAGGGPLLIAIEDLHWSDTATLAFLPVLARRLASLPALVAVTLRAEDSSPALRAALAELNRQRLTIEIALGGLTREDVGALVRTSFELGHPVRDDFLDALYTLTDGNPFFVEEVLTALVSTGDIFYADGAWSRKPLDELRIPQSIQEAVARRTARLGPAAAEVLTLAAVLGRHFDFVVLQQATGHDEVTLLALVKELIAAQLIVEESAERFAFRHALGRAAVYNTLLARERRVLHQRLAEALERAGGAVYAADLVRHYAEAQVWDRALHYADEAAAAALRAFAPREAVGYLTSALAAAERLPGTPLAPLLLRRGHALVLLDDFAAAHADYEAALEAAARRGDRADELQALISMGALWSWRDYTRVESYLGRIVAAARALGEPAQLAHSLNRVGNWQMNLDQPRAARHAHQEALEIFSALGDERAVAETLVAIGVCGHLAGELPQATAAFQRAIALFTAEGDRRNLANTLAYLCLRAEFDTEMIDIEHLGARSDAGERALSLARETEWRAAEALALVMIGSHSIARGDYGRAQLALETGLALGREIAHKTWSVHAQAGLGLLYLELLQLHRAVDELRQSFEQACALGSVLTARHIARYLVAAYAQQRAFDQADELLRHPLVHSPGSEEQSLVSRNLRLARAELALARGEPALALDEVAALIAATANRDGHVIPRLWLARGLAEVELRHYDAAHGTLTAALAAAQAQGRRPLIWRIQATLAGVLSAQRRREEAHAFSLAAQSMVDELARTVAVPELREAYRARAYAAIPQAATLTPRQALKRAFDGLTDRELDVARLVARGYTNRQIADALVLSERTVSTHIGNIYGKLGFTARAQLIAWAIEKSIGSAL
jgi:DNA-binding CsgD family transcriptional regulator/tetratricopeptide (TPR) repeat protein